MRGARILVFDGRFYVLPKLRMGDGPRGGVAVSAGFIFGGIRRPQERKIERPDSPPSPSDLPDYDFKDAKPKDFK